MSWIWFITGLIFGLLICGGAWLFIRWYTKRVSFVTKQGVNIFTHLNPESKRMTKAQIELYLDALVAHLVAEKLFSSEGSLFNMMKGTSLFWQIQPYWNNREKQYQSGMKCGNDIVVGWQPKFERTTLAHEYMHLFLERTQGYPDAGHRQKEYWALADGFAGVISY